MTIISHEEVKNLLNHIDNNEERNGWCINYCDGRRDYGCWWYKDKDELIASDSAITKIIKLQDYEKFAYDPDDNKLFMWRSGEDDYRFNPEILYFTQPVSIGSILAESSIRNRSLVRVIYT